MKKEYDLLCFIMRGQPVHLGHLAVINRAISLAKYVLILIGSAGNASSFRNPWSFEDREIMLRKSLLRGNCSSLDGDRHDAAIRNRVSIKPIYDKTYNDTAWVEQVQSIVKEVALEIANPDGFAVNGIADLKIGLIGHARDHTSYYLNLFPQWGSVDVECHNAIHATGIRKLYFDKEKHSQKHELLSVLPKPVANMLFDNIEDNNVYQNISAEYEFLKKHKEMWKNAPYPPTFQCVDSLVEQSGHILLVTRKAAPGAGLLAMPGGYVNQNEKLLDASIRELREETKLKVPDPVLRGSIVNEKTFDDPNRSERGRIFTQVFHIKLKDGPLPKVKGSDDASKAKFYPISDLKENLFFEDHFGIIQKMLGI